MKILFLDIDGVVNSADSTNFKGSLWPLDPYKAFLVGKIQDVTGCEVVLSSSWRHHPEGIAEVEKRIVPILDITPNDEHGFRGAEVQAWLDKNPEVTKYAILDDDMDFYAYQAPNFFKTRFMQEGLTDEIAQAVIDHLGEADRVTTRRATKG